MRGSGRRCGESEGEEGGIERKERLNGCEVLRVVIVPQTDMKVCVQTVLMPYPIALQSAPCISTSLTPYVPITPSMDCISELPAVGLHQNL
jgi:hypothetical protein